MAEEWAVLEVFGHRRHIGRLSTVRIAGVELVRIEVPNAEGDGFEAHEYGGSAIFGLHRMSEQAARDELARERQRWAPPQLTTGRPYDPHGVDDGASDDPDELEDIEQPYDEETAEP